MPNKKLTKAQLQIAVNILQEYIFFRTKENKEVFNAEFYNKIMEEYNLMKDPFTHLPCTPEEYAKNSLEYDRQTMIEKYGHCDGLE